MDRSPPGAGDGRTTLVRARRAVSVLFIVNGAVYANVVPRLPAIKADLGLSNTALGTAVAGLAVGALVSGLAAGWLIGRFTSGRVAVTCGLALGVVLPGFAAAPGWAVLAAVYFVLGALDSLMDVSMNAHALRVQRAYAHSIVSGLHGLWSVGAVAGGIVGTAAAALDVPLGLHLLAAGAVTVVAAMWTRLHILEGPDDVERIEHQAQTEAAPDRRRRAGRRLALLGSVVLFAAVIEDAPASWGAVLLRTELGATAAVAGLVFIAFQGAMTVGRLLGDRVVDRFGEVAVMRTGGLATTAGAGAGLLSGRPWGVIAGFAVAGLGAAVLFPLVFRAAGNVPGVSTGHGVAVASWIARIGFLVMPPAIGAVGDATSVRLGLVVVPLAGLAVAALAGSVGNERGHAARSVPAAVGPP